MEERRPRRQPLPGFYKLSLANKILVVTVTLLLLLGIAVAVGLQLALRSRLREEVAANTRMLATVAALRAGPLVVTRDRDALDRLVREVARVDSTLTRLIQPLG